MDSETLPRHRFDVLYDGGYYAAGSTAQEGRRAMIRKAFLMTLKPGHQAEYERRHNPIWPELQAALSEHGVRNYSIFLDRTSDRLFAYAEIEEEALWARLADTDVCRRWWAFMKDLMLTNDDDSPVAVDLDPVFHID
jgi:L-rhamnose mutarotase